MSLFDVIKYPIDINYRVEDLQRIPEAILNNWWIGSFYKLYGGNNRARIPAEPIRISMYMKNSTRKYIREIMLRRLKQDIGNI